MNTILPPQLISSRRPGRPFSANCETRSPHYDCQQHGDAIDLTVFLPGVDAAGVEIVVRGPDLVVIGRKSHVVRINFAAAHLEHAQLDYELRLRLGRDLDYAALTADLADGILSLHIPKRVALAAAA
ncbi:MAG: Hsp20/alpha crystallin family protein [Verrucomicrobia bacterium]|nr:MAG: Hsp20/alpha crystallin family protein [Verrucomicrobiota bacterium]